MKQAGGAVAAQEARPTDSAHRQSVDEVVAALATDLRRGLTDDDARSRFETHGPNELA